MIWSRTLLHFALTGQPAGLEAVSVVRDSVPLQYPATQANISDATPPPHHVHPNMHNHAAHSRHLTLFTRSATMKASSVVRLALQGHGTARRTLTHHHPASHLFHTVAGHSLRSDREEERERRALASLPTVALYHTTAPADSGVALRTGTCTL